MATAEQIMGAAEDGRRAFHVGVSIDNPPKYSDLSLVEHFRAGWLEAEKAEAEERAANRGDSQ